MDATATLWYGVRGEREDIPRAAYLELTEPKDSPYGEKVVDGIHIHIVWVCEQMCGAGGTIAVSYWDEGKAVDLATAGAVKAAVDTFLDQYNVPGERGVYLTADHS
jgi:hypothetical protein